jgi:hypothetical protein
MLIFTYLWNDRQLPVIRLNVGFIASMLVFIRHSKSLIQCLQQFGCGVCQLHMTRKLLITLSCIAFLLGGCKQYAYYQSPFHATTSSYKVMPVSGDSAAANFASGALFTGGVGDKLRDGYWGVNGNLYRSHSFGQWRGFYGLTGTAGMYRVRKIGSNGLHGPDAKYPNDSLINERSGSKFFGGLGASAGIYVTTPFDNGGEWRVLGLELNYQHEFGHYYSFRNKLPDTAANLVNRSRGYLAIGLHSDLIFDVRRGSSGIKIGAVFATRNETRYDINGDKSTMLPGYFSVTFHHTRDRVTGFWQTNLGTFTANLMMGINYRL